MERAADRKDPIIWKYNCYECGCEFESYSWSYNDPPMEYCCSYECYVEYESIVSKRDRKIKSVINDIKSI